ncbi:MAG: altronate hydrolase [Cyclobacteriaceae bacterium]|jgi:altronate hydrolase
MKKVLRIHPNDDLGVALTDLKVGETVTLGDQSIVIADDVKAKHKFALQDFKKGEEVHMYGLIVGTAKYDIKRGQVLTTFNLVHKSEKFSSEIQGEFHWTAPDVSKFKDKEFMGYHREDGQVGTGNYWLVFPLVFCENRNIETIKTAFEKGLGMERQDSYTQLVTQLVSSYQSDNFDIDSIDFTAETKTNVKPRIFENIDGIRFLTHQGGCGGIRQDSETLCRLMAGYVNNPSVAGATVLSLGCQNAQTEMLQKAFDAINPNLKKPVIIFDQQQTGKETDLIQNAITGTFKALIEANKEVRKPAPLSKLVVGLECGGSDGFSGISANPSVGYVSDLVVALGGKAILSEFPELCGVEQELINRTVDQKDATKFAAIMRAYEKAAEDAGSGFDMNPSPGNIKDGLITDAMKSAGAAKKGGTSPVTAVLDYTEYAMKPGLNLLCTPGNDVESTTGLAGSGANIILFTTGLGTPTGNPITPVLKVSSNTILAERMPDIIDIDTGPVIRGEKTIEEMGEQMLNHIIEVASGRIDSKAMILGQYDFIPWKRGVSL